MSQTVQFWVLFSLLVVVIVVFCGLALRRNRSDQHVGIAIVLVSVVFFAWPFAEQIVDPTALHHLTQISAVLFAATWLGAGVILVLRHARREQALEHPDIAMELAEDVFFRQMLPSSYALCWGVEAAIHVMLLYGAGIWDESVEDYGRDLANLGNFVMHGGPVLLHSLFIFFYADDLAEVIVGRAKTRFQRLADRMAALLLAVVVLGTYLALADASRIYKTSYPLGRGSVIMCSIFIASILFFYACFDRIFAERNKAK